jgi:pimeloyl-ACP methyl ester carboxylesterase
MPVAKAAGNVNIHYEIRGEGPPLLLISGTGHDHNFWSGQLPMFEQEYTCIVFDNRGMGNSSVPRPGYSLADMAGDAAAVLDDAGIDRAHVMGFSMGGHIAQELCLNHPGRVASLGLHHTWARNCPRLESFQRSRKRLAEWGDMEVLAEFSMLGLYSHAYYNAHADEMERKLRWLAEKSGPKEGWVGQLDATLRGDTLDRLHQIEVPTLVTASTHDLIVDTHHAEEIHSCIKGSRKVIMEGTGHVALIERPEEFGGICLDFLRGVSVKNPAGAKKSPCAS